MKKYIAVLAALATGALYASAQEEAPASSLSVTSSLGYESEYVFRGVQYADAILSPSIDVAYGNFYAGAWFALPAQNAALYTDEMDVYLGINTPLGEILSVDVGLTRYSYNDLVGHFLDDKNGATTEYYVGISADVLLSPSFYAYYDTDLDVYTLEVKVGHSIPLFGDFSLDLGASAGYMADDEGEDDLTYFGGSADISYAINDKASFAIGARYSYNSENGAVFGNGNSPEADHDICWFGTSFSFGF
jgi:uncharacterized protein (TIGR02001 family)